MEMFRTKNVHSSGILIGSPIHMDTQNNKIYVISLMSRVAIDNRWNIIERAFAIRFRCWIFTHTMCNHIIAVDVAFFALQLLSSIRWNSILSTAAFISYPFYVDHFNLTWHWNYITQTSSIIVEFYVLAITRQKKNTKKRENWIEIMLNLWWFNCV